MEYKVGQIINVGQKEVLITRIVKSDSYFFDRDKSEGYILRELYLETLDEKGEIEFISLSEDRETFPADPKAKILGPDTLEWRKFMSKGF